MRKRVVLVSAVAALVLVGVAVFLLVRSSLKQASAPAKPLRFVRPAIFADEKTPMWMSIQLAGGRPDTGSFYLFTAEGTFAGRVGLSTTGGSGEVTLSGADRTTFKASDTTRWVPRRVDVRGTIRPSEGVAEVKFRSGDRTYRLISAHPAEGPARVIARRAATDLTASDQSALSALLAPEVQAAVGDRGTGRWTSSLPASARIRTRGAGRVGRGPDGRWYFTQPVSVVRGATVLKTSQILLVFERGRWFFLGNGPLD